MAAATASCPSLRPCARNARRKLGAKKIGGGSDDDDDDEGGLLGLKKSSLEAASG